MIHVEVRGGIQRADDVIMTKSFKPSESKSMSSPSPASSPHPSLHLPSEIESQYRQMHDKTMHTLLSQSEERLFSSQVGASKEETWSQIGSPTAAPGASATNPDDEMPSFDLL
jgi:hypothetical protein